MTVPPPKGFTVDIYPIEGSQPILPLVTFLSGINIIASICFADYGGSSYPMVIDGGYVDFSIDLATAREFIPNRELLWTVTFTFLEIINQNFDREIQYAAFNEGVATYLGEVRLIHQPQTEGLKVGGTANATTSERALQAGSVSIPRAFEVETAQLRSGATCVLRNVASTIMHFLAEDLAPNDQSNNVFEMSYTHAGAKIHFADVRGRRTKPQMSLSYLTLGSQLIAENYFLRGYLRSTYGFLLWNNQRVGSFSLDCAKSGTTE